MEDNFSEKDSGIQNAYEITVDMTSFEKSVEATEHDSEDEITLGDTSSSWLITIISAIKVAFSLCLLIFSIILVSAAIFQKQTRATGGDYSLHPAIAFVMFWVLLLWLALMEGGLNCIVGLQPVDKALYAHSHPLAHGCTVLTHGEGRIARFIVGRQYLDLSIIFTSNFMATAIQNASVMGLPDLVSDIFLETNLAVSIIVIVIGQLISQVNSSKSTLDYINNYAMLTTSYLALFVEASGILHVVYLIEMIVHKISGKEDVSPKKSPLVKCAFWARVALSVVIIGFTLVATFYAIFRGETKMWAGVPSYASVILLIGLTLIAGIMDALQIAFMAVVHMSEDELKKHPVAQRNCQHVFSGQNLQMFMVGRQIFHTFILFTIARIISLDFSENVFGVSDFIQKMLEVGVLGALMTTAFASLSWRILANTFPMAFLSCPLTAPIIYICILFDRCGICYVAWPMARIVEIVFNLKDDSYYLGCSDDRKKTCENGFDDLESSENAAERDQ
jgi:hypothetical protein